MTTNLLFNLKVVNNRSQFAEYLISLLMIFQLCSDQVGKVAEWFRGIEDL
jgi:hypothetical protein